ncbi:GspH/FimT family pseudopilin [Candidatus Magnetaquicoccus inordinatus]|uniref:GspH/FimT family pseudopilin n=1 Tax=Candidatus Magnetaquicoccus inordinatus TaxID=2496818 RepID=UPI00187D3658|nr:GspH/FimT family pseudopilin [Candidatus Magnetaquicoccus inordinatus]
MKTRISPAGKNPDKGGYTLIELMVTLAILSLLASLTPMTMEAALPSLRLESTFREGAALMRFARSQAVFSHREVWVLLDRNTNLIGGGSLDRTVNCPPEMELAFTVAELEKRNENQGGIRFFPNGSSNSGPLYLGASPQHGRYNHCSRAKIDYFLFYNRALQDSELALIK